ncbi:MAG: ABC transporter permease [Opitutaceae bacterium]
MAAVRLLIARVAGCLRRRRREREMAEEMAAHLELQEAANRDRGMDAMEARYAALRQFGGVAQVQECCREQRGILWLENFGRDLRFAARGLRKAPRFAAIVLLTLACGIGATTAVFSGVNALLLRPLPVRAPGELVVAAASGPGAGTREFPYPLFEQSGDNRPFPYAFVSAFRERCTTLADVVAVTGWPMQRAVVARDCGLVEPVSAVVEEVSGNYFAALGVPLARGRGVEEADDGPGDVVPVAVVSHDFWQRRLGGDPAVVGKTLHLDGCAVTIVGVAAHGFTGAQVGLRCELWFPLQRSRVLDANMPWGREALQNDRQPLVHILGRLREGVSRRQAATELDGIFQHKLAELDPRRALPVGVPERANLLDQHLVLASAGAGYGGMRASLRTPLDVLMILVGVLQLAACANVAGLLLARGAAREHEFAVRAALGASRGRVVVQLLTECLLLAALAGALGVVVANGAVGFLRSEAAGLDLSLDARVLGFAAGLTLLTALGAGLVPAWRLSRRELGGSLKAMRLVWSRLNGGLVVMQIAFAFVLLAIAGLFVRTLQNMTGTETGFARQNRLLFDVGLAPEIPPPERAATYQRMASELESLAGVEGVSYYQGIDLLGDTAFVLEFDVPGREPVPGPARRASLVHVGPRFFEAMGVPLLRGRDFGRRDEAAMAAGVPALVIGEWAARLLFAEEDSLGRRVRFGTQDFEIVGVAKDVKYGGLRDEPRVIFYLATSVTPNAMRVTYVVETAGTPAALAGSLRAAVRRVDLRAQLSGFRTVAERLEGATSQERFTARLAGFFGMFALALSGLGLFGLLSYMVGRRTREIGIRLALGAPVRGILQLIIRDGVRLWSVGCVVGVAGALMLTGSLTALLFHVTATDPVSYAGAAGVLGLVSGAACFWPAWRASRIDPIEALRAE